MTVRNQNIKVYRGNSAAITVAVTQADGTPFDSTINANFRYRIATTSHATDAESLVRKTIGSGIVAATGGVTITLNPEDTDFDSGVYYHELKVWDGSDVSTAMVGAFIVKHSVGMGDRVAPTKISVSLSGKVPTRTP